MEIKVYFKSAWWWKPTVKVIYVIACYRLISLKTAERMINAVLRHSFKYRIGRNWQQVDNFRVTVERQ